MLDDSSATGKKLTEIYDSLGIALKDSEGQIRSTYDILADLAEQWDNLSKNEQEYIALTSAGSNQVQNFTALMENFSVAVEATATAYNSIDSASKENEKAMDTIEKKLQILRSQFEQLVLGEGGLQNVAKWFLDLGVAILKFANSDVGQTIIQLTLLVTSLNLVAKGFEALKISTKALGIVTLIKDVASLKAGMQTVVSSQLALDIATKGLTKSFMANAAAWAMTPMGMATIAVGAIVGIKAAYDHFNVTLEEHAEKLKELKSDYEETQTKADELEKQLENVRDRIDEINDKDDLSIADETQLRLLKEQEASLEHQVILQQELAKAAKVEATEEAKKTLNKKFADADIFGTSELYSGGVPIETINEGTLPEAIDILNKRMLEQQGIIDDLLYKKEQLIKANGDEKGSYETVEEYLNNTSDEYKELNTQIVEHETRRDNLRATTAGYIETMDEAISVADQEDEVIKNAIGTKNDYDEAIKRITGSEEKAQDQVKQTGDAIEYTDEQIQEYAEDMGITFEEAKELLTGTATSAKDLATSVEDLAKSVGLSVEELQALADTLGITNEVAAEIQSSWNNWNDSVDDIQSSYKTLSKAMEEYNEQGYYTTDTLQSLMSLSPEYISMLQEHNGQIVLNEEALRSKISAQAEEAKQIARNTAIARLNALANEEMATATTTSGNASESAASQHDTNTQRIEQETEAFKKYVRVNAAFSKARARGASTEQIQAILKDLDKQIELVDKWAEGLGTSFETSMNKATKSTNKTTNAVNKQKDALKKAKEALQEERDAEVESVEKRLDALYKEYESRKKAIEEEKKAFERNYESRKKAIEEEKKAFERNYESRKKAIEEEKKAFERNYESRKKAIEETRDTEINSIEDQKKAIEEEKKAFERNYESRKKAIEETRDTEINSIEDQKKAIEEERFARKKYWEEQLSNLEKQNKATETAISLQQKLSDLAKAQQTQNMVLKDGRFVYSSDESATTEAQQSLDDFIRQEDYEKQKTYLEEMRDMEDSNYEERLDNLNDYKDERKDYYEKLLSDLSDYKDRQDDYYEDILDDLSNYKDRQDDYYEDILDDLSNYKESRDDYYEDALDDLSDYKDSQDDYYEDILDDLSNYKESRDSYYEDALDEAKETYDRNKQELEDYKESIKDNYDKQIGNLEDYTNNLSEQYDTMLSNQNNYQDSSLSSLKNYVNDYNKILSNRSSTKNINKPADTLANAPSYKKMKAYAGGSNVIGSDQIALVGDNPKYHELVVGSKLNNDQGTIMSLQRGSGVVNASATNTLASIFNSLNGQKSVGQPVSNSSQSMSIQIGSISLPEVKDGQGFVDYLQNFSADITQQSFRRA